MEASSALPRAAHLSHALVLLLTHLVEEPVNRRIAGLWPMFDLNLGLLRLLSPDLVDQTLNGWVAGGVVS